MADLQYTLVQAARRGKVHAFAWHSEDGLTECGRDAQGWLIPPAPSRVGCRTCLAKLGLPVRVGTKKRIR